ncbi:GntR family transcriptional regulator [Williamsia limnetica]|uniref:GntR family transcriptional regulator n=1 Tax=Williamsia limnetica TaxID=882452 RepID=A0A318RJ97_WILLI|nr:GntR family transcriptional regulator [Williamsia limnetica]PYE15116.1 GntR family transcriptional regulator [Williamsia limnetica]
MAFQPIEHRSVPEDVFDQIVEGVVSGELRAGENLPSERELARVLGVSRPAVREAMKRVAAAGLVTIRQGGGTTVRDLRRFGGLDLLPKLLIRGGELDVAVARSVVEARAHIGPKVAELAALRATEDQIAVAREAAAHLAELSDPIGQQVAALDFWDAIVDGADSIAFRLMYNTMRTAYEPALPALASALSGEVGNADGYRRIVDSIARRDPSAAARAAAVLLEPATTALLSAFGEMEELLQQALSETAEEFLSESEEESLPKTEDDDDH